MLRPTLLSGPFFLLCTGLCAIGLRLAAAPEAPSTKAEFVGSQSCRECHPRFYQLWSTSHHGRAMQPFTAELARTALTEPTGSVAIGAFRYRAHPARGEVVEQGPDGEKAYPIVHTLGGKNVYYFLTPLERGRLQVLPVAYDVQRRQWYDTASSAMRHFGDASETPFFWKDPPYTFNTACFNCHVSQLEKNYDSPTDSYRTTWGEPGINCETCHGPAGQHLRAARALAPGEPLKDVGLVVARTMTPAQTNALCGACHAKLAPLTPAFPPGERFYDHFAMTTLEDPDFYPDGRDLGENFTLTTWGLSGCAQSQQLDCVACHTSSGRYRFRQGDPNAACLPCHEAKVKDVANHSHHAAGSTGARCIACHMPTTEFARMRRSDHSMRPPAPAATLAYGSPNACNLCHTDRDAAWADQQVRTWHPKDYQAPLLRRAGWIAAARSGNWASLPEILEYLAAPRREEIWATSLLRLLRRCADPAKWPAIQACLQDPSPLVRAAAIEALGDRVQADTLPLLLAAARDDFRLVRVRTAAVLAGLPRERLGAEDRRALEAATTEYLTSLQARPDDSLSRFNLGNHHLERREFAQAIAEYDAAIRFQPQSLPPFANRALAQSALGQNDRAEASLRQAIAIAPTHAALHLNLGLLLAELGRPADAAQAFRTALQHDARLAPAAFNLGVLLSADRPEESLEQCRRAFALRPDEPRYGYTLAFYLDRQGHTDEATRVLDAVVGQSPPTGEAYALLGALHERRQQRAAAAAVYRAAAANLRLPAAVRTGFLRRLQALSP